jgi:hypothetical protein
VEDKLPDPKLDPMKSINYRSSRNYRLNFQPNEINVLRAVRDRNDAAPEGISSIETLSGIRPNRRAPESAPIQSVEPTTGPWAEPQPALSVWCAWRRFAGEDGSPVRDTEEGPPFARRPQGWSNGRAIWETRPSNCPWATPQPALPSIARQPLLTVTRAADAQTGAPVGGGCVCVAPCDRLPVGDTTAGGSNTAGRGDGLPEVN